MMAADPSAAPAPAAVEEVVAARRESNEVVAALDLPLIVLKAGRREDALVRRALFVTTSVTLVRPAGETVPPTLYRWTHQAYLQRQICFTSITGLFACTAPQVELLPDKATGLSPTADDPADDFPLADADLRRLTDQLRQRAAAVFAADRRANVDPIFKAAGALVSTPPRR